MLDESVPVRLRRALATHTVRSVVEMGWSGVKNGKLLALTAQDFVTVDKNLQHQQSLATLPVSVAVRDAVSNELTALLPLVPALERVQKALQPKTCVLVQADT